MGVEEGLDSGAGELDDKLDEDDERHQFNPPRGANEAVSQVVPDVAGHEMQGENNGEHHAPNSTLLKKDGQIGPLKVGKYPIDDLTGSMERASAEENPQEGHKTKRQQPRDKTRGAGTLNSVKPWFTYLVDTQGDTMTRAPNDEGPGRSMP